MTSPAIFGAIRWDAWYTSNGPAANTAGALGQPKWQSRAPAHAIASARATTFAPTQTTFDAEITAAKNAGLKYWAYLMYGVNNGDANRSPEMMAGFNLHQSSSIKSQMKWCMMQQVGLFGAAGNYTTQVSGMVTYMQQSNYQRVLTNRPLLYLYWVSSDFATYWTSSYTNFKAALDALRTSAQAAGLGNPYVVVLADASVVGPIATNIGADAVSSYVVPDPKLVAGTFASLDTAAQSYWSSLAATGKPIVPICMAGFDRRPRIERPVPWEASTQRPGFGANVCVTPPTNAEMVTHLQAAANYVSANPSICPSTAALIYAWNEHDEGGWLAPTLGDPSGSRLAAITATIT